MSGRDKGALRTGLYVPGDRPERFDKAVATGAELVILDLEDAVADDRKAVARANVAAWLRARFCGEDRAESDEYLPMPIVQVRVNADPEADMAVFAPIFAEIGASAPLELRLPKVESTDDVAAVTTRVPDFPVTAIIESALGVERAIAIATHPSVTRLALGESDLASELGTKSPSVIGYARTRIVYACAAAGVPAPMMAAFPRIRELEALSEDCKSGRIDGWFGRVAIHPSQLPIIRSAFQSSEEDIAWASEVLSIAGRGGVGTLDSGEMVDRAMVGRAQRILARPRT